MKGVASGMEANGPSCPETASSLAATSTATGRSGAATRSCSPRPRREETASHNGVGGSVTPTPARTPRRIRKIRHLHLDSGSEPGCTCGGMPACMSAWLTGCTAGLLGGSCALSSEAATAS
eukprot:scaffold23126_cov241-Isochrysis_galbana.AAC.3